VGDGLQCQIFEIAIDGIEKSNRMDLLRDADIVVAVDTSRENAESVFFGRGLLEDIVAGRRFGDRLGVMVRVLYKGRPEEHERLITAVSKAKGVPPSELGVP